MDLDEIESISKELAVSAYWIKRHQICRVYFKKCALCGKPFAANYSRRNYCSESCSSKDRPVAYRQRNRKQLNARANAWKKANPLSKEDVKIRNDKYYKENKEKCIAYAIEYRKNNSEKIKERRADYYNANKDKLRERCRAWSKANKEKKREYEKKYRPNKVYFPNCIICGVQFRASRTSMVCCGDDCKRIRRIKRHWEIYASLDKAEKERRKERRSKVRRARYLLTNK